MKALFAREKLSELNLPIISLQDAIGVLKLEKTQASRLMRQLAEAGALIKIRRGLWAWPTIEPLSILTSLTSPFPSYISLQTALFYHGVIDQISPIFYGITLGRKQKIKTPLATFSIHHVDPEFFLGYETHYNPFFQMATPEKALLDYLYLSRVEPKLFGKLPEIDMEKISKKKLNQLFSTIKNEKTKKILSEKVDNLIFKS